ncbi:hypothetical protein RFI_22976, partial [Reticulomyxa filosa]
MFLAEIRHQFFILLKILSEFLIFLSYLWLKLKKLSTQKIVTYLRFNDRLSTNIYKLSLSQKKFCCTFKISDLKTLQIVSKAGATGKKKGKKQSRNGVKQTVQIEDSQHFGLSYGQEEHAGGFFRCSFNNCVNQTSVVKMSTLSEEESSGRIEENKKCPTWNEALEWQFDGKTLQDLKRQGSNIKLEFYIIPNFFSPSNELTEIPIDLKKFQLMTKHKHIQLAGYIVLDLRNALSNGKRLPNVSSTFMKLRNAKQAKHGVHPQINICYWCILQKSWTPNFCFV